MAEIASKYSSASFMFSQEEPRNCGAWSFVRPRLDYALGARTAYAGRPEMPTRNCTIDFLLSFWTETPLFGILEIWQETIAN